MFFDCEGAQLAVVDVLHLATGRQTLTHSVERSYHALTFRCKANSTIFYDDRELVLSDESILFVPSDLSYSRRAADEDMIVIHFLSNLAPCAELWVYIPENAALMEALFDEMLRVWKGREAGYRLKAGELLFRILYRIAVNEQKQGETLVGRAAKLIEKNAENSHFSVSELSPLLSVSGTWLRRQFHQEYGMTPKAYLTHYRLQMAAALLDTGYFSIREVARRSGFENEKYFSTVFRQCFGLSSTSYSTGRRT